MNEIRELRDTFGGDKYAINRHGVRFYEWQGVRFFQLDRTLDGSPFFFELTELQDDPRQLESRTYLPLSVPVKGQRYFGDGLSWAKAEALAVEAIQAKCDELA